MKPPRTLLTAAAAAVVVTGALAPAAAAAPPSASIALPGQDVFPEGITSQGSTFYVTSTTDGTVFRGTRQSPTATVLSPGGQDGRTTAVGIDVTRDGKTLVVAGGATGRVTVLDSRTGATLRAYTNRGGDTFLNDVAIAPNGDAYVTDSRTASLYRIPAAELGTPGPLGAPLPVFVDFTGTALTCGPGFNANGVVVTADGRYAVVVQSFTGNLYRVDLRTRAVAQVHLGGVALTSGDGLELVGGRTLYVVRNSLETIATVQLAKDAGSGTVVAQTDLPDLMFPTTATAVANQLLVINSQFDQRGGTPVEPFTVSSIPRP